MAKGCITEGNDEDAGKVEYPWAINDLVPRLGLTSVSPRWLRNRPTSRQFQIDSTEKRDVSLNDLMILANETRNRHLDVELKVRKEDTAKKGHSFKNQLRSSTEGISNNVEKVGQLGRPRLGFLSCFEVSNTCAKTPLLPARGEDAFASSNGRSRRTLSLTISNHWRHSDVTSTAHVRKQRMKIRELKAKGMRN